MNRFQFSANELATAAEILEDLATNELTAQPLSAEELASAQHLARSCALIIEMLDTEVDEEKESSYDGTLARINQRAIDAQKGGAE